MKYHKVKDNSIQYLKNASTAEQSTLYFKLRLKQRIAVQNVWFIQQCLKQKVFPKFVQLKSTSQTPSAKKAIEIGKINWLKEETRKWFIIRDNLLLHIKVLHSELTYKLHPIEFDILDDHTRLTISEIIYKKYTTQNNKLQNLINIKHPKIQEISNSNSNFHERVINLSNTQFKKEEIKLLENGPKYNPNINTKNVVETLVCEVELSLNHISDSNFTKEKVKKVLQDTPKPKQNHKEVSLIKSIQSKIKDNNLIMTRADKGNSIVILCKGEYQQKINTFLEKEDPLLLKKDPTLKIQNKLKTTLKDINGILSNQDKFKIINMNPTPPKLYGLIKIHKENAPIRPVVSYTNSPLSKLCFKLNQIYRDTSQFNAKHTIKNSVELSKTLKNVKVPNNGVLVSFDVTNMFPNIPNYDCLQIIANTLTIQNVNPVIKNEILSLFDLCINENYFQYDNKFYKQKDGLAMGSPLSPLLAEVFMSNLEENFLKSEYAKNISFWYRYVDDILVCFTGNDTDLQHTLNHLNSLHQKINFTMEKEKDNQINFLDITITRSHGEFSFDIYRKPTFTDTSIPANSTHPNSHKLAAYKSMIHRAFTIPLNEDTRKKELNTIIKIAQSNGFHSTTINSLINKKQKQFTINKIYPHIKSNKNTRYTKLTYFGPISDKIAQIISKNNIQVAFTPSQKISQLLFNAKEKTSPFKKSGVYKLNCKECNSSYIGQTGRNFNIRYNEHKKSFLLNKENSNIAKHCLETGHSFPDDSNLEILYTVPKSKKLNILESIEIYKHNKNPIINLLNDQTDLWNSPLFTVLYNDK